MQRPNKPELTVYIVSYGQKTRRAHCLTHEPLQAQVHDKSGALDPLLEPVCTHPVCEIATHDPLSLPLRLRRLPLVVLQEAT